MSPVLALCYYQSMITALKACLIWLMLLALPFQGYAAATVLPCAPHVAMQACADHLSPMVHAPTLQKHPTHGKSQPCAACCIGAAMASSYLPALPALRLYSHRIPFIAQFMSVVDLAFPERPPQLLPA